MQTDNFIRALVADRCGSSASIERTFAIAIAVGFSISAILFWLTLGPREDFAAAVQTVRFDFKIAEALLLAVTASVLLLRLARPDAPTPLRGAILAVAPALLVLAVVAELLLVPAGEWRTRLVGENALVCLTSIPLLSLPLLAAALTALRRAAPLSGQLAGGVAGLVASGLAAALYALMCPDDSPLFVAVWYGIAISAVSLFGALLGQRLLRW